MANAQHLRARKCGDFKISIINQSQNLLFFSSWSLIAYNVVCRNLSLAKKGKEEDEGEEEVSEKP